MSVVDIIISDKLLREIGVEVELTSHDHTNVNITRRRMFSNEPSLHTGRLNSGSGNESDSPDIAAWLDDVVSQYMEVSLSGLVDELNTADIAALLADFAEDEEDCLDIPAWVANVAAYYIPYLRPMEDDNSIIESKSSSPDVQNTPPLLANPEVAHFAEDAGTDVGGSVAWANDGHLEDFPHTHGSESVGDIIEEYYESQLSDPELSSSEAAPPLGSPLGHCGSFVSPPPTPLADPLGISEGSPLSSPRLQGLGIAPLDLDIPHYELEAIEVRPSAPLTPRPQLTQRARLADAASMVLFTYNCYTSEEW